VTILRHRWVSQKNQTASGWHDAAMLRRSAVPALALTASLVLVGGVASATVKNGGPGVDNLTGTSAKDTLRGRGGDDRLTGLAGGDLLVGGRGNDRIKGGPGLDDMGGGTGDDLVIAGFDNTDDRAYGGPGDDIVSGYHADQLSGGGGDDRMVLIDPEPGAFVLCGKGEDTVVTEGKPPAGTIADDCEHLQVN
jgi:Ca2+-binding RTX toxin-like protein